MITQHPYDRGMELWERSEALNLLGDLLRESAHGGRIALVAGEAGIGKSALVIEFARRCGPRARVLWGACDRLVTPRALGPLHDIGHQIGGRLAAQLRAAAPQEADLRGVPRRACRHAVHGRSRWWWSRTRTGPTRRRWTGWPSWAAGSTGCRRCCSSPTATTRWDRITRSAACWRRCPTRSSAGCRSSPCRRTAYASRRAGRAATANRSTSSPAATRCWSPSC